MRIYAVGDVHGHDTLLGAMMRRIEEDIAASSPARNIVVFLGDLIDRGPASAAVIERLRTLRGREFEAVFIAGNHEEVLLRIIDGEHSVVGDWLRFGGAECALSYGADTAALRQMTPQEAAAAIRALIPREHVRFLRSFADSFSAGDYLFVHAGIRPGVPLDQQSLTDLRWIRAPFLDFRSRHPKMVVHGHSISRDVEIRHGRIGVDTGAYRTGLLSGIVLEGAGRRVLQVRQQD